MTQIKASSAHFPADQEMDFSSMRIAALLNKPTVALGDLLAVEEILDQMDSNLTVDPKKMLSLKSAVRTTLHNNVGLLSIRWPRSGGAVYDIINELREELALPDPPLSR